MGNLNDVGLCQEVASWQRKNQSMREPPPGWMQARPPGPAYLQGEQMLEWRPTKGAAMERSPGAVPAESSRRRSSSEFAIPHRDALGPGLARLHDPWPPDGHERCRPDDFFDRGRGPIRQSSAGPLRQLSAGPTRQFSAPVRQSSAGPSRQARARSHAGVRMEDSPVRWPEGPLHGPNAAPPWRDDPVFRCAGPQRSRTPRWRGGPCSGLAEDAAPWDAAPWGPPASSQPSRASRPGSWGLDELGPQPGEGAGAEGERSFHNSQECREKSPPRIEDTAIGKGLSEFLKRGVAQAAPKKEAVRTEMVPSKDGGFIATIQKGFEGIFGHLAASKEEVLRKRGPMPAPEYEAVPGDDIDLRVQYYARQLPPHLGDCLKIYRVSKGEYEIGNDEVHLAWQSKVNPPNMQNPNGSIVKEVFVFTTSKENVDGPNHDGPDTIPCEPLPFYLRHSANVAYDLQYGSKVTKVPECSRLSFAEETGTLLKDGDADAKFNAMTVAIQQAKKREQAAMEWRKRNADGMASSAASRDCNDDVAKGWSSFDDPKGMAAPALSERSRCRGVEASPASERVRCRGVEASPPSENRAPLGAVDPQMAVSSPSQDATPGLGQPPATAEAAAAPVPTLGPIPGLDPPLLKLPPPPGPLPLSWGKPEVPVLHPPILLNSAPGLPHPFRAAFAG